MSTATTTKIEFLKKHLIQEKSYVVTETNYQYNDETYDNNGIGAPIKIFVDLEKANTFLIEKTHKFIKGENILSYFGNDGDLPFQPGKSERDLKKLGIAYLEGDYELNILDNFTLEQTKELLEILDLNFYEVHEIDVVL